MRKNVCKANFAAALAIIASLGCNIVKADAADALSGQVSQEATPQDKSYPGAITKSLTMTPGAGQFSADHLHVGRQVVITLYNPNDYAMRFDTSQRLGKDYSWVVPANSQRTVSFRYWNPVSDEVKFLQYQDPSSLVISQGEVKQPASEAALIGPPAPAVSEATPIYPQPPSYMPAQPIGPQPAPANQGKSAVRGYW